MGIVFRESWKNTVTTYLGFGIGAINVLFLYTKFMSAEYYGLVGVILSTSALLMPLMAFGVHNSIVKFHVGFTNEKERRSFNTLMLFLPAILLLPMALVVYFTYDEIAHFLSRKNLLVKDYIWHIFIIGMAMGYFEVFYAWAKVRMKSVIGNFLKEVFVRACVTVLLLLFYYEVIGMQFFLWALVAAYLLRTILMKIYAYSLEWPKLRFALPPNLKEILFYSILIIFGASAAVMVLEIDRFMINQYVALENVAYYSVAVFIATVVIVPSRAMHQITYPLTAELIQLKDNGGLKELYQKSSINLYLLSGLLFVLIMVNLDYLYDLLPQSYREGFVPVLLLALAKVFDSLLGNNNSILYNSKYYRTVLLFGVFLACTTVVLNILLIPNYGIKGAALSTFVAIMLFNIMKLLFVYAKFGIQPFTFSTLKTTLLLLGILGLFFWFRFPFHAIVNIILVSVCVGTIFIIGLYKLKLSKEMAEAILYLPNWIKSKRKPRSN